MVSLHTVQASNGLLRSNLPGLVAVFVGGTSGVGEFTLKEFAKNAQRPRVYFIGRSEESGSRIATECKALNPGGEFTFMKADTSLIRNVDIICNEIKVREEEINILFLTTGSFARTETEEKLLTALSLAYYSRTRFIVNLLPQLKAASSLRRVVSVFCGGKEGPIDSSDFGGFNAPTWPPLAARGHAASLVTLSLEAVARQAPTVSFAHVFPGAVKTGIARDMKGLVGFAITTIYKVIGPWVYIPQKECGERHLFFATSAMYIAKEGLANGLPLRSGVDTARGTDGVVGSGVYSLQQNCESAGPEVELLLAGLRKEGLLEKAWEHTESEFKRILG